MRAEGDEIANLAVKLSKTPLGGAVESTDRIIIDNSSNFIGKGDDN